MMRPLLAMTIVACWSSLVLPSESFSPARSSTSSSSSFVARSERFSSSSSTVDVDADEQQLRSMREDIERMRAEAIERVAAISERVNRSATKTAAEATTRTRSVPRTIANVDDDDDDVVRIADANRLDGTRWKITLDVGREPGTWMPKTWGVSGERLFVSFEVDFLGERSEHQSEDFLGGRAAKRLEVVDRAMTVSPSVRENRREVPLVRAGGWRVGKGQGPLGTDLLRFYVETEEEVSHRGSDVYLPKGRIYCTCGYFLLDERPGGTGHELRQSGEKERLRKKRAKLFKRHEDLKADVKRAGRFSFSGLMKMREMAQVGFDINDIDARLNDVRFLEPDKSMLRFSKRGDVGVTKRGSVVCKVQKGRYGGTEYHILGKVSLAEIETSPTPPPEQRRQRRDEGSDTTLRP